MHLNDNQNTIKAYSERKSKQDIELKATQRFCNEK